jgi:hypothetical protein
MATIVIFDTTDGTVQEVKHSAHTPDFVGRLDALINPDIPDIPVADMLVENDIIRELTEEEKAQRDGAAAVAAHIEFRTVNFEDLPGRLPELGWSLLQGIPFTDDERKIVIKEMIEFHSFLLAGHVLLGVDEITTQTPPAGVDVGRWNELVTQIQDMVPEWQG